jgi:protease-4
MARRVPAVLEVDLSRPVMEAPAGFALLRADSALLFEIEGAIRRGARDRKVAGLLLKLEAPEIGWSKAESLHRAVRIFRASGKPTAALISGGSTCAFLVAAAAETVVLDASATLDVQPLASESFFFKDLLEELGVQPELDHVGEFKSASEMFEKRASSEAHRIQMDAILSDLQSSIVSLVAEGRNLSPEIIAAALLRGPLLPEEARRAGLVDGVGDEDTAVEVLEARLGGKSKRVKYRRYLTRGRWRRLLWQWRRPRICVLHALGVLVSGDGGSSHRGQRSASARALAEQLEALRAQRRVKAIVVRVDTPGGGALASDRLRREIVATRKEKPVVVSMGDIAASGGYYLATAANGVVAEATSLTGSVGVVGGKFVLKRLLDRLGIYRESRATGEGAGFYSPFRSFTDAERARNREFLRHFYEKRFLPAVAEGRNMDLEQADHLGRGRVWTGRQAHQRGLVDRLGGLDEAIELACEKSGVPRHRARVTFYAPRRGLRGLLSFLPGFGAGGVIGAERFSLSYLAESLALVEDLAREEVLLVMPWLVRIR